MSATRPLSGGDLNRSTQHLLILLDKEVADGDVTDIVHGEAQERPLRTPGRYYQGMTETPAIERGRTPEATRVLWRANGLAPGFPLR